MHKIQLFALTVLISGSLYAMHREGQRAMKPPQVLEMVKDEIRESQALGPDAQVGCEEVCQYVVCCDGCDGSLDAPYDTKMCCIMACDECERDPSSQLICCLCSMYATGIMTALRQTHPDILANACLLAPFAWAAVEGCWHYKRVRANEIVARRRSKQKSN